MKNVLLASAFAVALAVGGTAMGGAAQAATTSVGAVLDAGNDADTWGFGNADLPTGPTDTVNFTLGAPAPGFSSWDLVFSGAASQSPLVSFVTVELFRAGGILLDSVTFIAPFQNIFTVAFNSLGAGNYYYEITHNSDRKYNGNIGITASNRAPVPLPGALPLLATGIAGLGAIAWRRKRKV